MMIRRLIIVMAGLVSAIMVYANEVAAIFGKAPYEGNVADQIVFSELDCGRTYDIEGICSLESENLNPTYSTYISTNHLHWYKSDRLTVIPQEGVYITAISFKCTAPDYCTMLTVSQGSTTIDKTIPVIDWSGMADEAFTLAANIAQVRVSYAIIEYTPAEQSALESIYTDMPDDEMAEPEYYNLQGVKVAIPTHGIYIRRQGSKVSKVFINRP